MRNRLGYSLGFAACLAWAALPAFGAGLKVAVVDMSEAIAAHSDTASAEELLQKQAQEFELEKREMITEFETLKEDFAALKEETQDRALSDEGRDAKLKEAEEKFLELRQQEQEIRETSLLRQKELTDRGTRMRNRIVDEIKDVIEKYVSKNSIDLVLNGSRANARAVLFHSDEIDITKDIVKLLSKEE